MDRPETTSSSFHVINELYDGYVSGHRVSSLEKGPLVAFGQGDDGNFAPPGCDVCSGTQLTESGIHRCRRRVQPPDPKSLAMGTNLDDTVVRLQSSVQIIFI